MVSRSRTGRRRASDHLESPRTHTEFKAIDATTVEAIDLSGVVIAR